MSVAIAHDYLTQRGGAERVVLSMARAFPGSPIYTTFYEPASTFPEFADLDVRVSPANRVGALRRNHRMALPVMAGLVRAIDIRADVTLCSSSGWAHGVRTTGRKVVYCHTPARWVYQFDLYRQNQLSTVQGAALRPLIRALRSWDRRSARSADRYIANSCLVAGRVRANYGIESDVLHPPPALGPGREHPVPGVTPGQSFFLMVSRLMPYKNVDVVVEAVRMTGHRLIVVGTGPDEDRLRTLSGSTVSFLGSVSEDELRYLYSACAGLVAVGHEDFGLSVLEANSFGKPVLALRSGGYLETVDEGVSGLFVDAPVPDRVAGSLIELERWEWDDSRITRHASDFSEERFIARLRSLVSEEMER